jgi:hypothetical protein
MNDDVPLQLFDPRLGEPALKVEALGATGIDLARPQRFNYFTIAWVRRGAGTFWADLAHHRASKRNRSCSPCRTRSSASSHATVGRRRTSST